MLERYKAATQKGAAMNDKLNLEMFGWVIGISIMVAWIAMPIWFSV